MKSYLSKNQSIFLLIFILVFGIFVFSSPVYAIDVGAAIATVIGWVVYVFVYVIGLLLFLVMWVLIQVAQYNDFINSAPVTFGWTIVRDMCNMFFILILLIIAFATILRVEKYSFKTLLPKLILMAVLINFSKLICGIFIDFTQVIMLTFVNGFKDIGSGNLTNMLGIESIMSINTAVTDDTGDVTSWSIAGAYILALLYSVISLVVIVTMLIVLVMRIVMIWIYVVLSPLAYLLSALPAGEKYASQWWSEFSKNLIVGPVLAFFIWLSFVSLGGVDTPSDVTALSGSGSLDDADTTNLTENMEGTGPQAAITEAGSPDHMIKFIISIAMLIGGLQISQQIGAQAGGATGKAMAGLQKAGSGAMKSVGTGLKRATGIERVQNAYKSYQDTKASERSSRAKDDATRANAFIGKTKRGVGQAAGGLMQKTSTGISNITSFRSNNKIGQATDEKARIEARTTSMISSIQTERTSKKSELTSVEKDLNRISQDRIAGRQAISSDTSISGVVKASKLADYDLETAEINKIRPQKAALEGRKASLSTELKELDDKEAEIKTGSQAEIEEQDEKISKAQERKDKNTKWINKGLGAVVGTGVGAVLGGPALAAIGAVGGYRAKGAFDNAGQANLKRAVNYNNQKIATSKDDLKSSGKEKIMDIIKNSENKYEHAAATAIAMEKGYFESSNAASQQKQKVHDRFKNDDRVAGVMNTAAEKYYVELSPPYADLAQANKVLENKKSTPEEKINANKSKASANAKIAGGLESGGIKISDMSNNAINLAIDAIASTMKDKSFQKQYDGTSDSQQAAIKVALETHIKNAESAGNHDEAYKAKKKLAYTESFNFDRFGASEPNSSDASKKRNHEQKKEFLGSMNDVETAKAVKNKNSRNQFLQEIKVHLDLGGAQISSQSTPEDIVGYLRNILPNAGLDTLDSTSKSIVNAVKAYALRPTSAPQNPPASPVI